MKVAKISRAGKVAAAIIENNNAHVIDTWVDEPAYKTEFDFCHLSVAELQKLADESKETLSIDSIAFEPAYGPLSKLICLGHNYKNHVEETNYKGGDFPNLFIKFPDVLVGHQAPLALPKNTSTHFDFEGELAVIIGKGGRNIARDDALNHVFGYSILMDGSLRDFQKHSVAAGKNFPQSGSMGPWIVTADDIPDPKALTLETRLSGTQMQHTTTDLMIFDVPFAIEYISKWTTLSPGDVISTGTPGGVGSRRDPQVWMKDGDVIEVEISSIGTLSNPIKNS